MLGAAPYWLKLVNFTSVLQENALKNKLKINSEYLIMQSPKTHAAPITGRQCSGCFELFGLFGSAAPTQSNRSVERPAHAKIVR
ncbi:hypothetical protein N480_00390 [Pseudoalteromonas luteoviolacea S2607]|nr:hypothetical protein N480_00390 [Pseudoalteromonas luteoviolacea S2607]